MITWSILPFAAFILLCWLEMRLPAKIHATAYSVGDWIMNLSGFFMQGIVVPFAGYFIAAHVLPNYFPSGQGILPLGIVGAFLLNVVGVDFLYYLQHRAFHQIPLLWKMHAPHHYSPVVNIWATSRNALITHFLFVYMLVNPVLGYLCDAPEAFFAGAMITAALDLFRHSNIRVKLPILQGIFVMPKDHHRHHDGKKPFANYGANFLVWDRIFNSADLQAEYPHTYSIPIPPRITTQLLFPWKD